MPYHVNKQDVKLQLREQQQIWEDEQVASGCSTPRALEFWSVGKLLRVVQASKAAVDPLETLAQYGITRLSVGCADHRRMTSRVADTSQMPTPDVVTYTSSFVWITGFLHFGEDLDDCDTLHLCDSSSKLATFLRDPSPQVMDQLVLVKRWELVDRTFSGKDTCKSLFLEVHDEKLVLLSPEKDFYAHWTLEDVLRVLESSYKTKDPPMYTGSEAWAVNVARLRGDRGTNDAVQATTGDEQLMIGKKQRRLYVVLGRVTSVSPISRQKDRENSHFFVEIESPPSRIEPRMQSVVNVMFTGVYNMRWHLFLRPGTTVFLTDLVKVLSRECEMVLLQTTHGHSHDSQRVVDGRPMGTSVLVWNELEGPRTSTFKWINNLSIESAIRCRGKLLDYEGKVCRLLWDECIELEGNDGTRVAVSLFHFPYEHELARLRKGSSVRICDAHVLRWPAPIGGRLVIGLCSRSHFAITGHSDPSESYFLASAPSHQSTVHKEWTCLGDFSRQSMALSMWLLDLLDALDAKFFFGTIGPKASMLSFPQTQHQQAAAQVAKTLRLSLNADYTRVAKTLSAVFLKCHAPDVENCSTLLLPSHEKLVTSYNVSTIRELQRFGESKLKSTTQAKCDDIKRAAAFQSVRLPAESLHWCLLAVCIRGNVDHGDLEVYDRTGSIALRLESTDKGTTFTDAQGMYLIRNFDLIVQDYNQIQAIEPLDTIPTVFCVCCSIADVELVALRKEELISSSIERQPSLGASKSQEITFLVTHVDALPLSSIRSSGKLAEYRVFHGIVCPIGKELQGAQFLKSVSTAEIVINTKRITWFIQKGGCYRVQALEVVQNGGTLAPLHGSVEDLIVETSIDYWDKVMGTTCSNRLCFDSLRKFRCQSDGASIKRKRSFCVYRVENEPILSMRLKCESFEHERCTSHDLCQQADQDVSGLVVIVENNHQQRCEDATRALNAKHLVNQSSFEMTLSEFMAMNVLRHFLQESEDVVQVSSLLQVPLLRRSQQRRDGENVIEERSAGRTVDPDLHKPHLVNLTGIIANKRYYWQSDMQQQANTCMGQSDVTGIKRSREHCDNDVRNSTRRLRCVLHVRDLQHLDTVEIRVDASRFGILGTLQLHSVVEFSRLQGFIARSSFKVFLSWSHLTAARLVSERDVCVRHDAEVFGSMAISFLNDLYHASSIDRRLHRYVVGVMHISYVLLKRKCKSCHQSLQLHKRRGCWQHAEGQVEAKYARKCAWKRQEMAPSDPFFSRQTYMGTAVRCIIDDGSGQAELFLDNDVAWELLRCTDGQRRRFEHIVSHYVDKLSYMPSHTSNESFGNSKAEQEREYYENELRAFVRNASLSLRSLVVFAQQFYTSRQKNGTSVLTFGKDTASSSATIITKTMPLPALEAKRVDQVHVQYEAKQRLDKLRVKNA